MEQRHHQIQNRLPIRDLVNQVESGAAHPPTCFVHEEANEFQILISGHEGQKLEFQLFLGGNRRRLYVLAEDANAGRADRYLWSFKIPAGADSKRIEIEQRESLSLIHIPKEKPVRALKMLSPLPVAVHQAYAS